MIPAAKSVPFRRLFALYQSLYLFPRHLHGVYLWGELEPEAGAAAGAGGVGKLPVVYAANHVSWWDGLVLFQLTERLTQSDPYILMDEKGLREYPFFRRLGAFSVNRDQPRDTLASLAYAETKLRAGHPLWIFPQSAITPPDRPIEALGGIGHLLRRLGPAELRPVTLHYALGDHQKPAATVMAGEPIRRDWSELSRDEAAALVAGLLQRQLEVHRRELTDRPLPDGGRFRLALRGGRSTSDRYRGWKEGWRGWKPFSRS